MHPVYTPDDFAPLEFDEELTDVVFDEDDEPAMPDEDGSDDDDRHDDSRGSQAGTALRQHHVTSPSAAPLQAADGSVRVDE
jgi:hypothetical protein